MTLPRPLIFTLAPAAVLVGMALAWTAGGTREVAPAVSYTLLDGSQVSSEHWRGKVVLVNFWATTCAVCLAEMPQIVATHQRFRSRGFDTVAVSMHYDPPALVARYAQLHQLPLGVAIDNTGEIARRFGNVRLTPTTLLIDQRGEIVKRIVGAPDFASLNALIEQLLAEG